MPGGLTRVASSANVRVVSMQRGGGSKDTWVMSGGAGRRVVHAAATTRSPRPTCVRSRAGIPSRVVENLFWFGRYDERCDDAARLLRLALNQKLQETDDDENSIAPVLALARAFGMLEEDDEDPDAALLAAAAQRRQPVRPAREPARARTRRVQPARPHVARQLAHHQQPDQGPGVQQGNASLSDTLSWLDRTITSLMTLSGFALDGMTRDDGWRFLSIGRRLERLAFQCLALQIAFAARRRLGPHLAAAPGRFDRHLPFALPGAAGMAAGARPAGARRRQSALGDVSDRGHAFRL